MISLPRTFAWIDLETTGLCEKTGYILEVALLITSQDGSVLNRYDAVVDYGVDLDMVLSNMDDYVTDMHTKSGLLAALKAQEGLALEDIERAMMAKLDREGVSTSRDAQAVLCGSSVHFDRRFIERHMPNLNKMLHYRILDVSAFKVAFPSIFPKVEVAHRAKADIEASLSMLRTMRSYVVI